VRRLAGVAALPALAAERVRLDHVLHRDDDLEVELLGIAGIHDLALPPCSHEEVPDALQRTLGGRQADALDRLIAHEVIESLQRQRQVAAALRRRHGVNLVDDHRLDPAEDLARLRADHQIQRLRRGDQDVRRLPAHRPALGLGRVARAQGDRDRRADPLQRSAQVALDVIGQSLERGDVDDPHARAEQLGLARQAVDPPKEGRERLPRAGRSADQGVRARGDRWPAGRLGGRGRLE
jgi:hypothetical protein